MNAVDYYRAECDRLRTNIDDLSVICSVLSSDYEWQGTSFAKGMAAAYEDVARKLVVVRHGTIDKTEG